MTLSRQDTERAFAKHRAIHERAAWPELADLFAPDACYHEPFFGRIEGREAIRAFLVKSMTGLEDWSFPIQWVNVDAGRVVTHWLNRLPGQRADGSHFEFRGITALTYGDDGQIVEQLDLYDRAEALAVIGAAKSSVVRLAARGLSLAKQPFVVGAHWFASRR